MPWEKSFDLDEALDCATRVFWAKGYEATSMANLVDGMGINKGSLYNAFGSKKQLFKRALLKYDRDRRQKLLTRLEALDDPVAAVSGLFDALIAESLADGEKKGCLLFNTALELPNHADDIQDMIGAAIGDFEASLGRWIRLGQARGAIPMSVDAGQTAKSLLALVVGLRVLARGACDAAALGAIKRDALRLITS